uniref:Sulfotransferase n=1 Tax=Leptobrachium leishanense TaxID=445787 RepID=A0A8C5QTY8_9ANUR
MSSSKPKTEREKLLEVMEKRSREAINLSKEDMLFNYKGVLYPTYLSSIETFQALQTLEARADDMVIVTYPKCGTNWMVQILHEVLYLTHNQEPTLKDTLLEFGKPDKLESINGQSSPRIFSTHMYYSDLPKSFLEKAKILVILRNPKDAAVSFYHFCNNLPVLPNYSSWNAFFQDFMSREVCYGSYFDHVLSWNEHLEENIMAVTYEDLKEDFAVHLKKITDFFGLDLTKDHVTEVEKKTTFKAMKEKSETTHGVVSDAMFRKGTNWAIQIFHEMIFHLQNKEVTIEQAMIEFGKPQKIEYLKEQPSPRVFSTHLYPDDLPKSFFEKKAKMLLILRNPKDTAVSYYHFCNTNPVLPSFASWDLFFNAYIEGKVIYGSYFDHVLDWNKHNDEENIMAVTFEDLKEDFPSELRKISDFFGLSLTDEQIALVESKTTFKSMKEKSSESHGKLGNVFFRKGEIGDWKNYFTEEQSQAVDAKFEEILAGTNLGKKINYNKYCKS